MKKIIEQVVANLPKNISAKQKNGYTLLKRQKIYIPVHEIGISCLSREVTELNLFFETILKLIDAGICDINEISDILGVDYKILKEVIIDMLVKEFIFTSEQQVTMTIKGKNALKERKLSVINKESLNSILVNMITGEVVESSRSAVKRIPRYKICLTEVYKIDTGFLEKNYQSFNSIYKKNLTENIAFRTRFLEKEIYRILGLEYEEEYYFEEELLVYKSDKADDYIYEITGDDNDRQYIKAFYNQVKDVIYPGMENFFERDSNLVNKLRSQHLINDSDTKLKNALIKKMTETKNIEEILPLYMQRRELIDDKEIEILFRLNREIEFRGIVISCQRLRSFFSEDVIDSINQLTKKNTWILYNGNEFKVKEYIRNNFNKNNSNIGFKECLIEDDMQFVCFYPGVFIEFTERIFRIFNKNISVLEAIIEFDQNEIKQKIDSILKKHKIPLL